MIPVKMVKLTIAWKTNFADLVEDAKSVADFSPSRQFFFGPGAIIGDGDRKSWDPRAPMIWDNRSFSLSRNKNINRKPSSGKSYEIMML